MTAPTSAFVARMKQEQESYRDQCLARRSPQEHVEVTALDDYPNVPEKIDALIAWLEKQKAAIPKEHRGTACFKIDTEWAYGEPNMRMRLWYTRPQTAEERKESAEARERVKAREDARDRAAFEALKRKFGESGQ